MSITPAAAAKQVAQSSQKDVEFEKLVKVTSDGSILSHLATNPDTKADFTAWLLPRVSEVFPLLREFSDPKFMAMGLLAAASAKARPAILELVANNIAESPALLNVLLRVSMKTKLDGPRFAPLVASLCDKRLGFETSSLATVVLSCLMPEGKDELNLFCKTQIAQNNKDSVIVAYSAIAAVCSLVPDLSVVLFKQPWILQPSISGQLFADLEVTMACLEMLSAVCNNKEMRIVVEQQFGKFIDNATHSHNLQTRLLAAVVRVKLVASGSANLSVSQTAKRIEELSVLFENYLDAADQHSERFLGPALEGLSITSRCLEVRTRCTQELVSALTQVIEKGKDASWVYGSLCTLNNLVDYPFKDTKEQAQARELKLKSSEATFMDLPNSITPEEVAKIVDMIIESKLVSWLSAGCSRFSLKSLEQVAALLRSLASSNVKPRKAKLAQQGIVTIAIYLWINDDQKRKLDEKHRCYAGEAIAKTLASVAPQLALNDRFPPELAVEPLKAQIYNAASERKNLDTYESLLALTNLASLDNAKVRNTITIKCWPKLEETVGSDFAMIQKATIELICNLSPCEACAHMFSQSNQFMIKVLAHCLEMPDEEGRHAAAGAIAMLLQWEGIPETFGHNDDMINCLIGALDRVEDGELQFRVLTAIDMMIADAETREDVEAPESMIHRGGIAKMEALAGSLAEGELRITKLLVSVLQKLASYKIRQSRYTRTDYVKEVPATSLME